MLKLGSIFYTEETVSAMGKHEICYRRWLVYLVQQQLDLCMPETNKDGVFCIRARHIGLNDTEEDYDIAPEYSYQTESLDDPPTVDGFCRYMRTQRSRTHKPISEKDWLRAKTRSKL